MSYDIDMLRLSGTGEPLKQARELLKTLSTRVERGERPKPSAEEDQRRIRLAAELIALHPSLRMEPFDGGFSFGCEITTDDPDCWIPYIEVEIESALVTFSYSADASRIFPELQRVIAVFERHGYVAYDPQTDRLLSSNVEPSASSFLTTRAAVIESMEARGETVIGWSTVPTAHSTRSVTHNVLVGVIVLLLGSLAVLAVKEIVFRPKGDFVLRTRAKFPSDIADRIKRAEETPPNRTIEDR